MMRVMVLAVASMIAACAVDADTGAPGDAPRTDFEAPIGGACSTPARGGCRGNCHLGACGYGDGACFEGVCRLTCDSAAADRCPATFFERHEPDVDGADQCVCVPG